jgi:hypothetical protein
MSTDAAVVRLARVTRSGPGYWLASLRAMLRFDLARARQWAGDDGHHPGLHGRGHGADIRLPLPAGQPSDRRAHHHRDPDPGPDPARLRACAGERGPAEAGGDVRLHLVAARTQERPGGLHVPAVHAAVTARCGAGPGGVRVALRGNPERHAAAPAGRLAVRGDGGVGGVRNGPGDRESAADQRGHERPRLRGAAVHADRLPAQPGARMAVRRRPGAPLLQHGRGDQGRPDHRAGHRPGVRVPDPVCLDRGGLGHDRMGDRTPTLAPTRSV